MSALLAPSLWALALLSGVMAGVYFAFSSFVMAALAALSKVEGIVAMQSINRVILSSMFMPLFAASSLGSAVVVVLGIARWGNAGSVPMVVGGGVYVVGMFVCTAACNVPLNDALDAADPLTAEAAQVWADYLQRWTRWNHVRTLSSILATGLFALAGRALS